MNDRLIDTGAERAVLGSLLINPDAISIVSDLVSVQDFHDEGHQIIYSAALSLLSQGSEIDYITMSDRIGDEKLLQIGGNGNGRGAAYLTYLTLKTPSSLRAAHYARIVNRLATLRGLMGAASEIAKLAYNANGSGLDELFDRARRLVDLKAPARSDEHLLMWLDSFTAFFTQQLDRCAEIDAQEEGVIPVRASLPWASLGKYVKYMRPGTLGGVIAQGGVGKTAFMECCAEDWAEAGLHVVFFHLELSHQSMLDRRMCRQASVPMRLLEDGFLDGRVTVATEKMQGWEGGIHYVHCPGWGATRIVRTAQKLRDSGDCDAAIVDYLQKMRRDFSRGLNAAQAVGWNIEVLKNGAEQMGIPVLMGAQISNLGKSETIKTAAHVRDTGELEDKANLLITIDRPILSADVKDSAGNVIAQAGVRSPFAACRVDKNTFGATGPFELLFLGDRFQFVEKSRETEALNF